MNCKRGYETAPSFLIFLILQSGQQSVNIRFCAAPADDQPDHGTCIVIRSPCIEEEIFFQLRDLVIIDYDKDLICLVRNPELIAFFLYSFGEPDSQLVFVT